MRDVHTSRYIPFRSLSSTSITSLSETYTRSTTQFFILILFSLETGRNNFTIVMIKPINKDDTALTKTPKHIFHILQNEP